MKRKYGLFVLLLTLLGVWPGFCFDTSKITLKAQNHTWLSSRAKELAMDLEIYQKVEDLHKHQMDVFRLPGQSLDIKTLTLRENILETLFIASLEINNVMAKIDEEITLDHELVQYINNKRGKSAQVANITNLVSSGAMAIVSSAIQLNSSPVLRNAGDTINVVAGGVASSLSAYALLQQKSGKAKLESRPNMLSQIFYGQSDIDEVAYPSFVWHYLNGGINLLDVKQYSRREKLIQRWVNYGKILPLTNPKSKVQIAMFTGMQKGSYSMNINDLEIRADMLSDLRAQIALMNNTLLELMLDIKAR